MSDNPQSRDEQFLNDRGIVFTELSEWEKPNIWRRGGKFFVPQHLSRERLSDVVALLANVFINQASLVHGGIKYAGYSPLFELTESGITQVYQVEACDDGGLKFTKVVE